MSKKKSQHIKHGQERNNHQSISDVSLISDDQERKIVVAIRWIAWMLPFFALLDWSVLFYSQIFSKLIFFYIAAEMLGGLYLVLIWKNRGYWPNFCSRGNRNWPGLFLSAYLGVVFLTNFFSANPYKSFFGTIAWSNGLLTLLHFFVIFVVLSAVFKKDDFWLIFFRLNSAVGLWISFSGIYQQVVNKAIFPDVGFGNPAYLAGYLIFIIFGNLALFFWEKEKNWKIFQTIGFALAMWSLFYTNDIRGAHLGVLVGLVVFGLFLLLGSQKKIIRKITFSLAILGLLGLSMGSLYFLKTGKVYEVFERSYTIKTRLLAWEAGMQGFLDRPWTGYGLENYTIVFEKYFNPSYYDSGTGNAGTEWGMDLPHNKLVEVAVSNGILALVAYLALWAAVFIFLHQKYRQTAEKKYPALAGMFAAYLVSILFLFDTVSTFALSFIYLGYLSAAYPNQNQHNSHGRKNVYLAALVAASLFLTAAVYFVAKPLEANSDYRQWLTNMKAQKLGEAMKCTDDLRSDKVYWIEEKIIAKQLIATVDKLNGKKEFKPEEKDFVRKMIEAGEYNVSRNPGLDYYVIVLGMVNNIAGNFDRSYWEKNAEMLEKIRQKGTARYDAYAVLAKSYANLGQLEKVGILMQEAVDLNPQISEVYFVFGGIYLQNNDFERAAGLFAKAVEKGCQTLKCYQGWADASSQKGDFSQATKAYEQIIRLKPSDPQMQANLVMLYVNNKEYEKARNLGENLKKKFPATQKQVDNLLNILPK